ncbi:hypothetical protein H1R20_g567, partial [Candolleomyces eurysporus]
MPVVNLETLAKDLRKTPPVARSVCLATLALTFYAASRPWPRAMQLVYKYELVFEQYEVWRLVTNFFLGSTSPQLIFQVAMLYQAADALESGPYRNRSCDLAWQMFFACIGILGATRPFKASIHLDALIACLSYLASATAPPGSTTSFMGFFTLPLSNLPYLLIFLGLLKGGPWGAGIAVAGALVGFAWFHLIWKGLFATKTFGSTHPPGILAEYGRAPGWLRDAFGERRQPTNGGGLKKGGNVGQGVKLNVGGGGCCGSSAAALCG